MFCKNYSEIENSNDAKQENQIHKTCERETLFPLPEEFWVAWGGIVATWAIGRSFEKTQSSNHFSRFVTGNRQRRPSILDDDQAVG